MKSLIICKSGKQSAKKRVNYLDKQSFITKHYAYKYISQANAGFSLVEIIAVVLMVGILAVIAIPSWNAFINRQRLNKANDAVLNTLQEVQQEAKNKKLKYSVSFRNNNNLPEIIFHADSETVNSSSPWKTLGGNLGLKSGQVWIGTNLNTPPNNSNILVIPNDGNTFKKITFDYNGTIPIDTTVPIKIVVAAPVGGNPTQASGLKRCVIIETLLGGMRTAKDNQCN